MIALLNVGIIDSPFYSYTLYTLKDHFISYLIKFELFYKKNVCYIMFYFACSEKGCMPF